MKYSNGNNVLGLSEIYKFGIEIEADNVDTRKNGKSLYDSKESNEFFERVKWKRASKYEEKLVANGGAECISPILHDREEDWQNLIDVCEQIKKYPGTKGNRVVANEKCGCHVHFDAGILEHNPEIMKNFLILYTESEELIYKMCNEKNVAMRKGAFLNKKFSITGSITFIMKCLMNAPDGMAGPTGKKMLEELNEGNLKTSFKKFGIIKGFLVGKLKADYKRYAGLNLTNLGNSKKDTIEFRMANGTLNPETIKQNVLLYASLLETARKMTKEPEKIKPELKSFFNRNVSEEEKVDALLGLLFENEQDKQIYKERWESVKDAKIFKNNYKRNFAQNRFCREDIKKSFKDISISKIKDTVINIKGCFNTMENDFKAKLNRDVIGIDNMEIEAKKYDSNYLNKNNYEKEGVEYDRI